MHTVLAGFAGVLIRYHGLYSICFEWMGAIGNACAPNRNRVVFQAGDRLLIWLTKQVA